MNVTPPRAAQPTTLSRDRPESAAPPPAKYKKATAEISAMASLRFKMDSNQRPSD